MSGSGVFEELIGHPGAKAVLRGALRTGEGHVLLTGPPASGKSVALECIEEYVPGAKYHDASGFSAAELRDVLKKDPTVLCLDEVDSMNNSSYDVLQVPMEQGRVTKNTRTESYDVDVGVQIVASCNDSDQLPGQIQSRFREIRFEAYDLADYLRVCGELLPKSVEWIEDTETARRVAASVHDILGTLDVRDPRDAARMAESVKGTVAVARGLDDPNAEVESDPLLPEEIEDRQADGSPTGQEEPNVGIRGMEGITTIRREEDDHGNPD